MPDLLTLAQTILQNEKKPMHFRDIAKKAMIQDKSLGNDLEDCARKIGNKLSAHINKHGKSKEAIFKRVKNNTGGDKAGIYTLISRTIPKPPPPPPIQIPTVTTAFTGKAGEYGVFSELLYWGYNPAMMVVDYGVDIVASKDGKYFHIQVKTSNPSPNGSYGFSIDKKIFEANENAMTFYVLVMRRNINGKQFSDYAIMSSNFITYLVQNKIITSTTNISFKITIQNEKFLVNGKTEIPRINEFSRIK